MNLIMHTPDKNTPQEELELEVVTHELVMRHANKIREAGYEDVSEMAVIIGRTVCGTYGHRPRLSGRGAPVIQQLWVCETCGKFVRAGEFEAARLQASLQSKSVSSR